MTRAASVEEKAAVKDDKMTEADWDLLGQKLYALLSIALRDNGHQE